MKNEYFFKYHNSKCHAFLELQFLYVYGSIMSLLKRILLLVIKLSHENKDYKVIKSILYDIVQSN